MLKILYNHTEIRVCYEWNHYTNGFCILPEYGFCKFIWYVIQLLHGFMHFVLGFLTDVSAVVQNTGNGSYGKARQFRYIFNIRQ